MRNKIISFNKLKARIIFELNFKDKISKILTHFPTPLIVGLTAGLNLPDSQH